MLKLNGNKTIVIKQVVFLFALLNCILFGIYILVNSQSKLDLLELYKKETPLVELKVYREDISPEASNGYITATEEGFYFSYSKSKEKEVAFTAAYFLMDDLQINYFDYDYVDIRLTALKAKRIPVSIVLFYSDTLFQYLTEYITVKPGTNDYKLQLSSFKTPAEWYQDHGFATQHVPRTRKNNVHKIAFESCHLLERGVQDKYEFSKVILGKSNKVFIFLLLAVNFVLAFIFIFLNFRRIRLAKVKHIPIEALDIKSVELPIDKITNYLARNFSDSSLSIIDVQKAIGIGQKRIANEIKQNFDLSFPQYLAKIRIEESKRLLQQNKFQSISEVAFAVGFNSSSNFNRVFKSLEKMSPNQFLNTAS